MPSKPHRIDVHVGAKLRQRRTLVGMGQTTLGEAVGITFQQVQKYENGGNRISASKLFDFAQALGVEPAYFFEDAPAGKKAAPLTSDDPLAKRETLELVRDYVRIGKPALRQTIREMVRAISAEAA
jgi:transcriptional regulator with XRE-family HTH domain